MEKIRALQSENSHDDVTKEPALLAPSKRSLIIRDAFNALTGMTLNGNGSGLEQVLKSVIAGCVLCH